MKNFEFKIYKKKYTINLLSMLFVLVRLPVLRPVAQFDISLKQQFEHLFRSGKTPISRKENIDISGFEFPIIGGKGFD